MYSATGVDAGNHAEHKLRSKREKVRVTMRPLLSRCSAGDCWTGPRRFRCTLYSPRKTKSVLVRSLRESRSCWPHLSGVAGLSFLSLPLTLLYPLPLKIVVDSVLGTQPLPRWLLPVARFADPHRAALEISILLLLGIAALVNLQGLASWWLQTYAGEKLVWDFRARLLNHVQRLPLVFHDRYGASDSVYRIQHDASAIQYVTIQGMVPLLTAFFTLLGMILVTARIDAVLAWLALLITPILFLLSLGCGRIVRKRSQTIKGLDSSAMSVIQEVIGSIRVIKAFGQEGWEHARFVRRSGERMSEQVRLAFQQALFNVLIGLTIAGGTAAALYVGVQHVRAGRLTIGSLLMIMAYMVQVYEPLQILSTKMTELQAWLASLDRAFLLLDQQPEIIERAEARALSRARGEIEFRNVSFAYDNSGRGLRDLTFHIPAAARVGIVGATGAGKTTLLNLLMRFYDASSGTVLLDGMDVREYRIADLRRQFAVVLQEPVLFAASIAENIAYGKPAASDTEIMDAARAAASHEFILNLPEGYETQAGERGSRISGGERQRISLARAFLRDSPTLKSCDLILVLDQGELVEVRSCTPESWSRAAGS